MKYEHVCFREARASKALMKLVRRIVPQAPAIGAPARVYMGVRGNGDSCRVGSENDLARPCWVLGYSLALGEACRVKPCDANTVRLGVYVKLVGKVDGISSATVHISCLAGCVDVPRRGRGKSK